ncbi:MAG: hypothetical protein AB3N23_03970 [Paracoccaceae bacterium]
MMMHRLRTLLGFGLIAALLLTAQGMAVARGAGTIAGQVELCAGGVTRTVYVDDTGSPVDPPHICPDCLLHLLGSVPPGDFDLAAPISFTRATPFVQIVHAVRTRPLFQQARAPPTRA